LETSKVSKIEGPNRWDFLFVAVMPIVCFLFDPILFQNTPLVSFIYVAAIELSVLFFASFLWGDTAARWFLNGGLFLGAGIALGVGLMLLPLSLFGLIFIIGILGFVPFATASRFYHRLKSNSGPWPRSLSQLLSMIVGIAGLLVLPYITFATINAKQQEFLSGFEGLTAIDTKARVESIQSVWYCKISCRTEIISRFHAGALPLDEPQFRDAFKKGTGDNYDDSFLYD
jgi:hypothetical protein